jgi:hypothetical protein
MGMGVKHYKKDGTVHKGAYHKHPNGKLMSGKTMSSKSVDLFHYGDLSKKSKEKARSQWR